MWHNEDEAWLNVAKGILKKIKEVKHKSFKCNEKQILEIKKSTLIQESLDEVIKPGGIEMRNLEDVLMSFLKAYNNWYFSPLRIQKWGGKQQGFEKLSQYDTYTIKEHLEKLLDKGKIKKTTSRQGNLIYKML